MEQQNNNLVNTNQANHTSNQIDHIPASGRSTMDDSLIKALKAVGEQNYEIEQRNKGYEKIIEDQEAKSQELSKKTATLEKDLDNLKKEKNNSDADLRKLRDNTFTILSIFAALLSFLSINFTILINAKNGLVWICVLIILIGALLTFTSLIIYASNMSIDKSARKGYTICLIILGLVLVAAGGIIGFSNVSSLDENSDSNKCNTESANLSPKQDDTKD